MTYGVGACRFIKPSIRLIIDSVAGNRFDDYKLYKIRYLNAMPSTPVKAIGTASATFY
ncbi:hypothetical protein [Mucilaginibacter hurinus]|uniref:hypothetical protein n=1 Tax=Mucilaginibacter hurinus TaxID=2201324 RepID=UPI001314323C|nr:hypothetical protein [Mucilaginibacter hurinus]